MVYVYAKYELLSFCSYTMHKVIKSILFCSQGQLLQGLDVKMLKTPSSASGVPKYYHI